MLFLSISGTQTKVRQSRGEGGVEGNKEIFLVFFRWRERLFPLLEMERGMQIVDVLMNPLIHTKIPNGNC